VGKKLYVGNLSYSVSNADLETMFAPFGTVRSAQVIEDRDTGRSKGFGFVEMGTDQEALAAVEAAVAGHRSAVSVRRVSEGIAGDLMRVMWRQHH